MKSFSTSEAQKMMEDLNMPNFDLCFVAIRNMSTLLAVIQVKPGDKVLYFKWAGDSMETPSGEQFVVVHESDILCKV